MTLDEMIQELFDGIQDSKESPINNADVTIRVETAQALIQTLYRLSTLGYGDGKG